LTLHFQGLLDSITRVRGVRGAMIVAAADGLVVADTLLGDVNGKAVAALASNLYKRLGSATTTAGIGEPRFVHLQAGNGALLVLSAGEDMLVVAVTEPTINAGLVRLEMLRAAEVVA
jgi:predicted regulator of Ras-like GTPase activity (Roadblock/LC7/MglB family)